MSDYHLSDEDVLSPWLERKRSERKSLARAATESELAKAVRDSASEIDEKWAKEAARCCGVDEGRRCRKLIDAFGPIWEAGFREGLDPGKEGSDD